MCTGELVKDEKEIQERGKREGMTGTVLELRFCLVTLSLTRHDGHYTRDNYWVFVMMACYNYSR